MPRNAMPKQTKDQGTVISGTVRPGDTFRLHFDFSGASQASAMVRVRLVQMETHVDGTRLQVCEVHVLDALAL